MALSRSNPYPTRPARGKWLLLRALDAILLAVLGWIAVRLTGWHWLTPVYAVLAAGWIVRSLIELVWPKLSTAAVDSLSEEQREHLLQRLRDVEAWIEDFAGLAPAVIPPRPRIALTGFVSYAPGNHDVALPPSHLLKLGDADLRMTVAHEVGHARRRWLSMRALRWRAKFMEEIYADRFALIATGGTPDDWERAMHAVAALEGNDLNEEDLEFTVRGRQLRTWFRDRVASAS